MTILGTRPEIIRLSRVIPLLDQYADQIVVHTGQNYDVTLNDIFFDQLNLRKPDYPLESKAETPMQEIGLILTHCEQVIRRAKPNRLLILGDTNSALSALVAKRYGIPVFHMEAGNRCYDDRVPEEVNRRIIDHCSDILMPYTERSRANLIREGIPGEKIYVTGNPISEVLDYYQAQIASSTVLQDLGLKPRRYFLVTLHRAENVDIPQRLNDFIRAFRQLTLTFNVPVICSLHPRTRSQLQQHQIVPGEGIKMMQPLGLFEFVSLEKNALCVLSDSGTVQEECCLYQVPNVTLRDVTERPETLETGSNLTTGCDGDLIATAVKIVINQSRRWNPPPEYQVGNVSEKVLKIVLSYYE